MRRLPFAGGYLRLDRSPALKRHPSLIPFSHDHHHALVHARRLRDAADSPGETRLEAAQAFADFFTAETTTHFRDEEELLFPLLGAAESRPDALLARLLLEHAELRALASDLRRAVDAASVPPALLTRIGELLERHIRSEERELFPLIERTASEADLDALRPPERNEDSGGKVVHLSTLGGTDGPVWGTATPDLNATLLAWSEGRGTPEHVNDACDVLVVVLAGRGSLRLDATEHPVGVGDAVVIPKGVARRITAGAGGLRYLTAHVRRGGLSISTGADVDRWRSRSGRTATD